MSHTPGAGHPQGWENKLADRSSLPPVPGEERGRPLALYPEVLHYHRYHGSSSKASSGKKSGYGGSTEGGDMACGSRTSPAYIHWATNLRDLLEDAEGVRLFQHFVNGAGPPHTDRLNFFFACQGFKQQSSHDPSRVKSLVGAIYKFLKKSQLTIPEDVRRRIKLGLKNEEPLDIDIFDSMQMEIEKIIKETTYISFLQSDAYIKYAQETQSSSHGHSSGTISSSSSSKELYGNIFPNALATLHEGEELSINHPLRIGPSSSSQMPQRLTKNLLMATQERRLQQPEPFSGMFGRNKSVYSYSHQSYTGYCPTSKQDSELQSMSSGRTNSDAMSMSGSSVDGISLSRGVHSTRQHTRHHPSIMESAAMNRSIQTRDMLIPRTFRMQKEECTPLPTDDFARLLTEKLEKVKREQESHEKFSKKLMEAAIDAPNQGIPARIVAAALKEKLQLDDDNDQDILDQHVSRVWADLTPARSPGRLTASPHLPGQRRRYRDQHSTLSAQSALSADSGNVRDFSDNASSERTSTSSICKSRSVSRKTLNDLTDSGVSVISDTPPMHSMRYNRKSFSRSGSAERPGQAITDLQMPSTSIQLDEARRRLVVEQIIAAGGCAPPPVPRHTKRSSEKSSAKFPAPAPPPVLAPASVPAPPPQAPASAPASAPAILTGPLLDDSNSTIVLITFYDEADRYKIRIPGFHVTLKQFKEFLPKKGRYRYFFKTKCEELGNETILEEIFNDAELLPLWDAKVVANVKNIE